MIPRTSRMPRPPNIYTAILRGDLESIERLVEKGEKVTEHVSEEGHNHLHFIAGKKGSPRAIPLLIRLGLDVNAVSRSGNTPLHLAIFNRHVSCFDALLEAGADAHAKGEADWIPLHLAICHGKDHSGHFIRRLVDLGADIREFESTEKTDPMLLAITMHNDSAVKTLLECGYEDAMGFDAVKEALKESKNLRHDESGIASYLQAWIQSREASMAIERIDGMFPRP